MSLSNIQIEWGVSNKPSSPIRSLVHIRANVDETPDDGYVRFFAASPPDYRYSFSGSGLPYASPEQAFEGTPNAGKVKVSGGMVDITLLHPNAYYVGLGTVYVPPSVHIWYISGGVRKDASIKINDGIPFRMLTYPQYPTRPRIGPEFYTPAYTFARSQEQILRDSAYPPPGVHEMPRNFWGLRPPI